MTTASMWPPIWATPPAMHGTVRRTPPSPSRRDWGRQRFCCCLEAGRPTPRGRPCNLNGRVDSTDTTPILQEAVGIDQASIPNLPSATIELFTLNFQVNAGAAGGARQRRSTCDDTDRGNGNVAGLWQPPDAGPGRHHRRAGPDRWTADRAAGRAPQRTGHQPTWHRHAEYMPARPAAASSTST